MGGTAIAASRHTGACHVAIRTAALWFSHVLYSYLFYNSLPGARAPLRRAARPVEPGAMPAPFARGKVPLDALYTNNRQL